MKKTRKGGDVLNALGGLRKDVEAVVRATEEGVASTIAENVYNRADEYVPEDTGELRESGGFRKVEHAHYLVEFTNWKAFMLEMNIPEEQPLSGKNGPAPFGLPGNAKQYTRPGSGPLYLTRAVDEEANRDKFIKYVRDHLGRFKKRGNY